MTAQDEEKMRLTPVVSCFLLRKDTSPPQLCLVKRSQRVGSYHAHWAAVSGFIEAGVSPEEQAYTEIREETGLQKDQVRLLKRGAVVAYRDEEIQRHWQIHPFLCEALDPEAIKLDWEATEMRWIAPDDLGNYETVPRLYEAFLAASAGEPIES